MNSWDVLRDPTGLLRQALDDLMNPAALRIIGLIFIVVLSLFYAMKPLNAALAGRWRVWLAGGSSTSHGGNA